jgi:hypothetical protein
MHTEMWLFRNLKAAPALYMRQVAQSVSDQATG